jgi:ribosome-associated heat shock protein Hsp15
VGETVEIVQGRERRVVVVSGVADRRGPASAAAALYEETPESLEAREQLRLERRLTQPIFGARPTKLERRRLEALRKAAQRRP